MNASGQRRGRGRSLSRERIARTALALADREGVEAMSMRRVAADLGVGTMTLYGYVSDKDDLLLAVLDEATRETPLPPPTGPWPERLRALALAMRATLARHPSGVELRLRAPLLSLGALRVTEAAMEILEEAGFTPADAARAYRMIFVYIFGYVSFSPRQDARRVREETEAVLRALDPESFPALSAAATEAAATMTGSNEQFAWGLDLLLRGLEAARGSSVSSG